MRSNPLPLAALATVLALPAVAPAALAQTQAPVTAAPLAPQGAPQGAPPTTYQNVPPAAYPGAPTPSQGAPVTQYQGMTPQGVPPGTSPTTGARPGNQVGTGMSMPTSNRASNISPSDTRSDVAPNLPAPPLGENSPPSAYLRAAQGALATGRTGEAQQALEMAQTRMLDRSVPYGQTNSVSENPGVVAINRALQALAAGDRATCMAQIQAALSSAP